MKTVDHIDQAGFSNSVTSEPPNLILSPFNFDPTSTPDYGDAKSGTADAASLPVLQDLIQDPETGVAQEALREVDMASLEVVTSEDTARQVAESQRIGVVTPADAARRVAGGQRSGDVVDERSMPLGGFPGASAQKGVTW